MHGSDPSLARTESLPRAAASSGALLKSFDCHGFWVVSLAWAEVPELGLELLADGGGDHAVKIWNADGPESTSCNLGQYLVKDGALPEIAERVVPNTKGGVTVQKRNGLLRINGWILALPSRPTAAFSRVPARTARSGSGRSRRAAINGRSCASGTRDSASR